MAPPNSSPALDIIYSRVPELYNAAYNTYGAKSYVTLENEIWPVEQGSSQGCPLSSSFFNLGISLIIEELSTIKEFTQCWFADDGVFMVLQRLLRKHGA